MSLISERVIDDFFMWAKQNENREIFPAISEKEDSYYMERDTEKTCIMEYSFQNMSTVRKMLEEYADLESEPYMLKKLTIELCQNRYAGHIGMKYDRNQWNSVEASQEKQNELPEFRYEF